MPDTHACPGCGADVPYAQLACKPDWFRLPKPLRDDITAAYRRRRSDLRPHLLAVRAAVQWYGANPSRERGDV